jgi:hypothetical protein
VRTDFGQVNVTNQISELQFARTTSHLHVAKRGRLPKASTLCSKHYLAQFLSDWNARVEASLQSQYEAAGGGAATFTKPIQARSHGRGAWLLFVRDNAHRKTMQEMGQEWDETAQAEYLERFKEQSGADSISKCTGVDTPFGIGDRNWRSSCCLYKKDVG